MELMTIYRGVAPIEAKIVQGMGPDELGDRWALDLSIAEEYAARDAREPIA